MSENDGDVNANFEDAGLVLDKNVPVCSIQSLPEKWGCIDHLTYMYFFFFNIRWSWERQWKIGVDFLFAFGIHSEAQVCGEKNNRCRCLASDVISVV